VLGLELVPRPNFGIDGAWLAVGDAQVHLIVTPDGVPVGEPPPTLNPMASHAAFSIGDYAGTLAQLKEHGLEVLETAPEIGQMWVRDPDGHVIELIDPTRR